ncbi:MAG: response regulator [Gammaproteobacteria bacterium]|nr:response regulator [Gammaproteobacteria bacterium]
MPIHGSQRDTPSIDPDVPLIIIADDDPSIRLMLHHIIVKERYQALEASDGREALDLVEKHKPNLVLLDAIMPEQDGFVTCNIIKQKYPEIPVIMITSLDDDPSVEQAFRFGADDYITKPINWSVLKHRIGRTLQFNQSAQRQAENSLESQIEQNKYRLLFRPRIKLSDESIVAVEAQFIHFGSEARPLINPQCATPLSLKAIKNLMLGACLNFKQLKNKGLITDRLILPVFPFIDNPQYYVDMIRNIVPETGIDIKSLELIINENYLHDPVSRQLYSRLAELPVSITISQFSFSLHSLNYLLKNRCNSIELNIPMIHHALANISDDSVDIEWFKRLLTPYKKQQISLIAADIEYPEEILLANQLDCNEAWGIAIKPAFSPENY